MPNPLMRLGTPNQSAGPLADSDVHPVGENPRLEQYKGQNFPYRGIESHGVTPTDSWTPVPANVDGVDIEYTSEEPEPDPIPVRVVSEVSNSQRKFRIIRGVTNTSVGAQQIPLQAVGPMHNRRTLKFQNLGTVNMYIAAQQESASAAFGWLVLPNGSEDFMNAPDSALWVVSSDGTAQPFAIKVEYETELNR